MEEEQEAMNHHHWERMMEAIRKILGSFKVQAINKDARNLAVTLEAETPEVAQEVLETVREYQKKFPVNSKWFVLASLLVFWAGFVVTHNQLKKYFANKERGQD